MMPGNLATRRPTAPASASARRNTAADGGAAVFPAQLGITTTLRFRPQVAIFRDGDDAHYLYVLAEGAARLCKVRSNGRRQIVRLLLPGDLFGFEIGTKHTLTAEALSNVVVRRCPRSYIERLSDAAPDAHRMVMASLRRELSTAQSHLVMIGRQTAKERVASFLLLLHAGTGLQAGDILDLPVGREDFADYLGLTMETVSRVLSELKRAGSIKFLRNSRQIMIRDMGALRAVAEGDGTEDREADTRARSAR